MTTPSARPITRFAPSPTGHLHIGGARTALFAWAYAMGRSGSFVLRIEDTDQARSSESAARGILQDLAWLGIEWTDGPAFTTEDGRVVGGDPRSVGPFFQAERIATYNEHIERLIAAGKAYHAFDTPEQLEAKRKAATAAKQQYRYDRAALEIPAAERIRRAGAGEDHVVRFLTPDVPVTVVDEVLGEVTVQPGELDDFVIRKKDGFPTYHFAVVIDDELMGVTHVIRGQEHLYNTPKHIALQDALGFRRPVYAHLPLIFNQDGSKMSKRDKDKAAREAAKAAGLAAPPVGAIPPADFAAWMKDPKSQLETEQLRALAGAVRIELPEIDVEDFRAGGYLPETVCNYIALLGWSPPGEAGENVEKFDTEFLKKWFDLPRIGKVNGKFDRKKLLAFNTDSMAAMSDEEFERRWREWCLRYEPTLVARLGDDRFRTLAAATRLRCKTFRDAADGARFALVADDAVALDSAAVEKVLKKGDGEGLAVLKDLREMIAGLSKFDPPAIHAAVEKFCADRAVGMGKVAQPLRVALTGGTVSPPIDATLAVIGKEGVLKRIDRCLDAVR